MQARCRPMPILLMLPRVSISSRMLGESLRKLLELPANNSTSFQLRTPRWCLPLHLNLTMAIDLHRCAVAGDPDDLLLTRVYPAPLRSARTPFQRDRARIVQARAFRRLSGETQVFTRRASDSFRSRP